MPFPALPRLQTERLLLRAVEQADLPALLAVNGDDDVTRYLPYASWRDAADAQAWYARVCERRENGSSMQFAVVDKRSKTVIGSCLLFNLDDANAHAEIGYVLGKAYWGSGYMREAVAALIDYVFEGLSLHRVEAIADPRNLASDRLLTNLGFTREGLLRERWIMNGEIQDGNYYGLLRHEWPPAKP
jgi:[ribosomal protein S5]-alanine N-acetyltransferase